MPWLDRGAIDEQDPTRDSRVAWLVDEVCNRQAVIHRYEDVRRRERGGKWDGSGYPLVQADDRLMEQLSGHHDPADQREDSLDAMDSRHAWQGLVKLVNRTTTSRRSCDSSPKMPTCRSRCLLCPQRSHGGDPLGCGAGDIHCVGWSDDRFCPLWRP